MPGCLAGSGGLSHGAGSVPTSLGWLPVWTVGTAGPLPSMLVRCLRTGCSGCCVGRAGTSTGSVVTCAVTWSSTASGSPNSSAAYCRTSSRAASVSHRYSVNNLCIGQQRQQERPRLPTRFHPPEPARDVRERRVELRHPLLDRYAVASGRRTIFDCLHKSSMITRRPRPHLPTRRPASTRPHSSPIVNVTFPGWSICATRRLDVSPAQRGGIGGVSLGLMAYLDPKGEGDNSMPANQQSCPGVGNGVLGDPRDMAKAGSPEP
jgi:hypothetical protein